MSSSPRVSIIYCFRDRDIERVKRSLDSLKNQSSQSFIVIFVNYGSKTSITVDLETTLKEYSFVKYIYNETRGMPWNRAHALNTGIVKAETDFIFTADIDLIFKSNFIEKLEEFITSGQAAFFPTFLLPEGFSQWENLELLEDFPKTSKMGLGLSLLPLPALKEINGYDEFFTYYGYEDNDLHFRVESLGINTSFYEDEVLIYHQWHPPFMESHQRFPEGWRWFMKNYFDEKSKDKSSLRRNNDREWGYVYSKQSRPCLREFQKEEINYQNLVGDRLYISFVLSNSFFSLDSNQYLAYTFNGEKFQNFEESKAVKVMTMLNKVIKRIDYIPFLIESKFRDKHVSSYEVRDLILLFIYNNRNSIADYFLDVNIENNELFFILIKD